MLLQKSKVPKVPVMTHYPGMSLKKEEFYSPEDLICGRTVNIFGREMLIFNCDEFTHQYYKERLGITQNPLYLDHKNPKYVYNPVPPYTGLGSEEDSLGSVKALEPKRPKIDEKKIFKQDIHILWFQCKLVSTEPDDENRIFLLSFFCGDDTIQVYEKCDKNSGRVGGKFLERKTHKNPATGKNYSEKDMLIGKTVYLGGWRF